MIGTVIGNYKITGKIGEGGMGAVFRGFDEMLEREVAIKMLRPNLTQDSEIAERFRAEAVTLAKLNHPNIATLHNFFRQSEDYFMVMEFVRGETIDQLIRRTGAIPAEQAVYLFGQALAGIGHAHISGIIHRDIKPANMMITEKGTVKVMDFGIARVLGTNRMTRQGSIVGTVEYMAPEQIQGEDSDARTDIYSLGILLYEMVTGRLPFAKDSEFGLMMAQIQEPPPPPRQFVPNLPLHIEQAIMRALAKNPNARFQTVGEFRTALEATRIAPGIPTTGTGDHQTPPTPTVVLPAVGQPNNTAETIRLNTGATAPPPPSATQAVPQQFTSPNSLNPNPGYGQMPMATPNYTSGNSAINFGAPNTYGPASGASASGSGKSGLKMLALAIPLLAVLAGGGYYFFTSGASPAPSSDTTPPGTTAPPVKLDPQPSLPPPTTAPAPAPPTGEKAAQEKESFPADEGQKNEEAAAQQQKRKAAEAAAAKERERQRKAKEARDLLDK